MLDIVAASLLKSSLTNRRILFLRTANLTAFFVICMASLGLESLFVLKRILRFCDVIFSAPLKACINLESIFRKMCDKVVGF